MPQHTSLLIIGAGPFALAAAAYALEHHIDHLVVGKPMDFWKSNMPKGMYLRSACDWHLDPMDIHTIELYLQTKDLRPPDVEPLSLDFYLGYAQWFQEQKGIEPLPVLVHHLDYADDVSRPLTATLDNGDVISAKNVLLALGNRYFQNVPEPYAGLLPPGRYSHTCDFVALDSLLGKRCLIIGGRQSAFEWAALAREQGAVTVHVCHRHDTPSFTPSDWSWVNPLVDAIAINPGWFRNLTADDKQAINHHMWLEGRAKLEPWLWPRLDHDTVTLWPNSQVAACEEASNGDIIVQLDNGQRLTVDQIILATGYKANVGNLQLLAQGNVLAGLKASNGSPVLDEHFQSSVPGLYFTGFAASQDFGPFFGFTVAVRASAKIIGASLVA